MGWDGEWVNATEHSGKTDHANRQFFAHERFYSTQLLSVNTIILTVLHVVIGQIVDYWMLQKNLFYFEIRLSLL